jgi:hypothetical protein
MKGRCINAPVKAADRATNCSNLSTGWGPKQTWSPVFVSNPDTRSFWMIPKLSSIAIINLIANLPFPYHKPEQNAATRFD